jgi:hypothetical protein
VSLRTRYVFFVGINAAVAIATLVAFLLAVTDRIESNVTGMFVLGFLSVATATIAILMLVSRGRIFGNAKTRRSQP